MCSNEEESIQCVKGRSEWVVAFPPPLPSDSVLVVSQLEIENSLGDDNNNNDDWTMKMTTMMTVTMMTRKLTKIVTVMRKIMPRKEDRDDDEKDFDKKLNKDSDGDE